MKTWLKQLFDRYQALSLREKQWVICGTICVVFFILYKGIWEPSLEAVDSLREQVISMRKTVSELQSKDRALQQNTKTAHSKTAIDNPIALMGVMKSQINQAGLSDSLTEMKQSGNNSLVLRFQKVEFDRFMTFLVKSLKIYSFEVTKLSVTATHTPGYVEVELMVA